jgi:flagellar motor component MotA
MRDKQVDDWVRENMLLSDEDKRQCVEITYSLLWIALEVRRHGLLSIDEKVPKMRDIFLRKALSLSLDSMPPDELRKTLQHDFMEAYKNDISENKNRELFRRLLITEGVTEIIKGTNPMHIAVYLASFFGEDYFKISD